MKTPLLIPLPGNDWLAITLAANLGYDKGTLELRTFPDGETYLRFLTSPEQRSVALVCTLNHPNDKILPVLFAAATARELKAKRVGLLSPYLAYMRQDRRFKAGEGVTSQQIARLLSHSFDWLITVDPHLHRYGSLADIYSIPTRVVHAAPLISQWIRANVASPIVIGPDTESEQWVAAVAAEAGAPYSVLNKVRRGDRDVEITLKDLSMWTDRTPVLVDDIVSSGRTMIESTRLLTKAGWPPPVAIAVHGLFADASDVLLEQAGARLVTSNTVLHRTNAIDIAPLLTGPIAEFAIGP
jgi:ribose-phosphate pyrophosphokinase